MLCVLHFHIHFRISLSIFKIRLLALWCTFDFASTYWFMENDSLKLWKLPIHEHDLPFDLCFFYNLPQQYFSLFRKEALHSFSWFSPKYFMLLIILKIVFFIISFSNYLEYFQYFSFFIILLVLLLQKYIHNSFINGKWIKILWVVKYLKIALLISHGWFMIQCKFAKNVEGML